jgi:hypothetical protein
VYQLSEGGRGYWNGMHLNMSERKTPKEQLVISRKSDQEYYYPTRCVYYTTEAGGGGGGWEIYWIGVHLNMSDSEVVVYSVHITDKW